MRTLCRLAGWTILAVVMVMGWVLRFSQPHLTETQLFLANWPIVFPALFALYLLHLSERYFP